MSRKKTFPCGHSGKGRFCHRCQAAKNEQAKSVSEGKSNGKSRGGEDPVKADKEAWRETFEADPIPLSHLPNRNLVKRARMILSEIDKGAPWHQFNGKRLQHDRNVVSIPLGRRYRILFRTDDGAPKPVEVLSHEAYNGTKPGRR
ncbi:MAG: hypothetical protein R6X02_31810 [Enhygromyxa sp.]